MIHDRLNVICGAVFMMIGALFIQQSLRVDLGSWQRIGPGGLPLVLAALLILIGALILFGARRSGGTDAFGAVSWCSIFFILLAPVSFGLTVRGLGFIGSVFLACAIASVASVRMTPQRIIALVVAVTVFATIVFSYGLGLPIERVGAWLRF